MTDLGPSNDDPAIRQHALGDREVIDLATKLRSLVWSWWMNDLARLLVVFGWRDPIFESPDWVRFDAGLGPGSCDVVGRSGAAERIEVAVTTLFTDDAIGHAGIEDAFALMSSTLTAALGEPTTRITGTSPEIRWVGAETTLVLMNLVLMVRLNVVTNE